MAHCTTQYVRYISIAEALSRGGHQAPTRYWAKLQPEALDEVVRGATSLLERLFQGIVR